MAHTPLRLDRIRVQTARMLEIYALLRRELNEGTGLRLSTGDLGGLQNAIEAIEANMRQLQAAVIAYQEECSAPDPEARELEEILDAVLKWAQEEGE